MKKLFLVMAIAALASCNSGSDESTTPAADTTTTAPAPEATTDTTMAPAVDTTATAPAAH